MTTEQKYNIGRGVRLARQRKRRSDAMKASWARRKFDKETEKPAFDRCVELATENKVYRDALPDKNVPDTFSQIEQLVLTWRGLETQKWQVDGTPQLGPILEGAITRIRLEIIELCRDYPQHTLD